MPIVPILIGLAIAGGIFAATRRPRTGGGPGGRASAAGSASVASGPNVSPGCVVVPPMADGSCPPGYFTQYVPGQAGITRCASQGCFAEAGSQASFENPPAYGGGGDVFGLITDGIGALSDVASGDSPLCGVPLIGKAACAAVSQAAGGYVDAAADAVATVASFTNSKP